MHRATKLLLTAVATITIALALLQGTGAFLTTQSDTIGQGIHLTPHPGDNGDFAYYDEDGELTVDLTAENPNLEGEGVSIDAGTTVRDIFTVTNTNPEPARVWLDLDQPFLTFVARGESIEGKGNAVVLGQNESVAVGLRVDTTEDVTVDIVRDQFEVNAVPAEAATDSTQGTDADIQTASVPAVSVAKPAPNERRVTLWHVTGSKTADLDRMHVAGANVTLDRVALAPTREDVVRVDIVGSPEPVGGVGALPAGRDAQPDGYLDLRQAIGTGGFETVRLYVSVDRDYLDWRGTDPADVTLLEYGDGNWTELDARLVEHGERMHYVATTDALGTVVVASGQPDIQVAGVRVADRDVVPGETVTVRASVENDGMADGRRELAVAVDDAAVEREPVALDPDERAVVRYELTFEEPGTHSLQVGTVDAGEVVVSRAAGADQTTGVGDGSAGTGDSQGTGAEQEATDAGAPGLSTQGGEADPGAVVAVVVGAASVLVSVVVLRRLTSV
ncbi:CARDB domain-containing protein [Haloarchaeobius amylolyticus]|uniref:CARDB domain-containing protein n=1 Tax=Haloarchaeobius amylolyticus TaxID=1198296 RepID=UPI00226D6C34